MTVNMGTFDQTTVLWSTETFTNANQSNATKAPGMMRIDDGRYLVLYIMPMIVIIGTIGNLLSVVVLIASRMHNTSVHFYLILLAFADTTLLYFGALKTWIRVLTGFELNHVSPLACQSVNFITLVALHMAAWILVLITLDRFIAVWFPLRATTMCTLGRSALAACILTAVVLAYNLHVFWTHKLTPATGCRPLTRDHGLALTLVKVITYSVLPFIIILSLNIAIIVRLRRTAPALQGRMTRGIIVSASTGGTVGEDGASLQRTGTTTAMNGNVSAGASQSTVRSQAHVTYMLLTVSFAWLLLTAPFSLFTLFNQNQPTEPDAKRTYFITRTVAFLLYYTNHSINFFLYCITGNKFRHKLIELFCGPVRRQCLRRRRRDGPVYSPSIKTLRSNCAVDIEMQDQQQPSRRKTPACMQPLLPQQQHQQQLTRQAEEEQQPLQPQRKRQKKTSGDVIRAKFYLDGDNV